MTQAKWSEMRKVSPEMYFKNNLGRILGNGESRRMCF